MWGQGRGEVSVVWHAGRWVTVTQPVRSDHRSVPFHLHGPAAGHTASAHDLSPSAVSEFTASALNFSVISSSLTALLVFFIFLISFLKSTLV